MLVTALLVTAFVPVLAPVCAPVQESWVTLQLATQRGDAMVAAPVGKVVIAGGEDATSIGFSSLVEITDEATGAQSFAQLGTPRARGAAVSVGARAVFAGGFTSVSMTGLPSTDAVDIYDAVLGTVTTATLSAPRYALAGAVVGDIAVFGGGELTIGFAGPVASQAVDIYDSAAGTWSTSALARPRSALAATALGTSVLFAGGRDSVFVYEDVDILDVPTGVWTSAQLSQARSNLAATSVEGVALFAGGSAAGFAPSAVVDIYEPGVGWSTAALSVPRSDLVAVTIGTRAYFIGGWTNGGPTNVVDVYDAATGLWSVGPSIPAADAYSSSAVSGPRAYVPNGAALSTELFVLTSAAPLGVRYCTPAVANSGGLPATIEAAGRSIASVLPYRVTLYATALPPSVFGYYLASLNPGLVPMPPGSAGNLCLGGSILRIKSSTANSGNMRTLVHEVDVDDVDEVGSPDPIQAGATWHFQAWFRDPVTVSNFTDAVAITFF